MRGWGRPLVLEAGNFMEVEPSRGPAINALVLDRLEQEGEPALTPGPRELSAWREFTRLLREREIPIVSSNLRVREEGTEQRVGRRTAILTVEGVRIGILGILGPKPFQQIDAPEGVEFAIEDPATTIRELLPGLRAEAEIVIVLGCMTDPEAATLAEQIPGVDLWISGYDSVPSDRPVLRGRALLGRTGQKGQYLSMTHLIVAPDGGIVDWGGRNVPLDAKVPADARVDSIVAQIAGTQAGGCH